jgi:hypothetical protein
MKNENGQKLVTGIDIEAIFDIRITVGAKKDWKSVEKKLDLNDPPNTVKEIPKDKAKA